MFTLCIDAGDPCGRGMGLGMSVDMDMSVDMGKEARLSWLKSAC
jgi:hypothetical protein